MTWATPDVEWQRVWDTQPNESDNLLDTLMEIDAKFVKALVSVMAGDMLLSDGTQHPFLASVTDVVDAGKIPTESQRNAFLRVFRYLRHRQAQGFPLQVETESEKSDRALASKKLVSLAGQHLDLFTDRTKAVVVSMTKHFEQHGTLTIGQLAFLKTIVETIPENLFRR